MKKINQIAPENCNKSKCKSCIFGNTPIELGEGRIEEIKAYLIEGKSHICHVTNKTCYGAMEFQAKVFHRMGYIPQPTPECLQEIAAIVLGLTKK